MIVGYRISKVEAERKKDGPGKGLRLNIDIKDVGGKGENVEVTYDYTADYMDGIGRILMSGMVVDKAEKKAADEARKMWKDKKDLPTDYKVAILNSINYVASTEGVLAAKIVRLAPPLAPPRISKKA